MLGTYGRRPIKGLVNPVARGILATGLTPNMVTIVGATLTVLVAVTLIPTGHLVWAAALSGVLAASDLFDGAMARLSGGGTRFGATLDATCDRLTDGAVFAAMAWWIIYSSDYHPSLAIAAFIVLISSQVISYVKARGEASGLSVNGGLIERPERLLIGLVGLGLEGLSVPYALPIALWFLAITSILSLIHI